MNELDIYIAESILRDVKRLQKDLNNVKGKDYTETSSRLEDVVIIIEDILKDAKS